MNSSLGCDKYSVAALGLLVPVLALSGCAAGGYSASPRPAIAADGAESPSDADAAEEEPDHLVAEALEACESAQEFWQEGDTESALASLDLAYERLLQIPDDPDLIQQKGDLRNLISRRIVEIDRSGPTTAAELGSPIPVDVNEQVQREIDRFRGPERKFFLDAYQRSGRYRPMIVRMLRKAGLPEELSWLPLVESGYKTRALSSARALGMWQFISSTGSRYGLDRSHWVDERMDPEKSTAAAIQYLTDLHGMFGDWLTALASYNCGEHRVMSVIRHQEKDYLDNFWDLFGALPSETARYVPRFLATLVIVRDPGKYGFDLPEPLPPVTWKTVDVDRHVRLPALGRALGLEPKTLTRLNPELRYSTTPSESYSLRVPQSAAPSFDTTLAALPPYVPPPEVTYASHRVRGGETLSTIARRYGTSVAAIVRTNHLHSRHRIRVGQRLKIMQRNASRSVVASSAGASRYHTVRRGDSLWRLASRYGTTVHRIKRDNGLPDNRLVIGQRLKIATGSGGRTGSTRYRVRRGDTVGRIAEAQNVPIDSLLRANGLSRSSRIHPGQVLRFPD